MAWTQTCIRRGFLWTVAIVVLVATGSRASHSDEKYNGWTFYSADELYRICKSQDVGDHRACTSYVCGVLDGWSAEYILNGRKTYSICLPEGATCQRLSDTTVAFLDKNSEARKSGAAGVIGYSLQQAFPCRGADGSSN
jgi:hypothetical protein